jgi:hypothetical protein
MWRFVGRLICCHLQLHVPNYNCDYGAPNPNPKNKTIKHALLTRRMKQHGNHQPLTRINIKWPYMWRGIRC